MDDLVGFLRDRLDEDEQNARARRGIFPTPGVDENGAVWLHIRPGGNAVITRYAHPVEGYDDMAKLRNWADTASGWTGTRVLAEVQAKRRLLELHPYSTQRRTVGERQLRSGYGPDWETRLPDLDTPYCTTCNVCEGVANVAGGEPCETLRLLALPYAGHAKYRPEWAPAA